MSSLAATQADGFYIPPEYIDAGKDVKKRQQNNGKGHNQFLQRGIVRFELPYKGICASCKCTISRGTRFNAHKKKTGESHLTKSIYELIMKCRSDGCAQRFVIRNNPQDKCFDYHQGISMQKGQVHLQGRTSSATGNVPIHDMTSADFGVVSSRSKLERMERRAAKQCQIEANDKLNDKLHRRSQHTTKRDADRNAEIRKRFRTDRTAKKERLKTASQKGWRYGMELRLQNAPADVRQSRQMVFGTSTRAQEKERWSKVRSSSIFSAPAKSESSKRRRRAIQQNALSASGTGGSSSSKIGSEVIQPMYASSSQPTTSPPINMVPAHVPSNNMAQKKARFH